MLSSSLMYLSKWQEMCKDTAASLTSLCLYPRTVFSGQHGGELPLTPTQAGARGTSLCKNIS